MPTVYRLPVDQLNQELYDITVWIKRLKLNKLGSRARCKPRQTTELHSLNKHGGVLVGFHVYKILGKHKLIYRDKKLMNGCLGNQGKGNDCQGHVGYFLGDGNAFHTTVNSDICTCQCLLN